MGSWPRQVAKMKRRTTAHDYPSSDETTDHSNKIARYAGRVAGYVHCPPTPDPRINKL